MNATLGTEITDWNVDSGRLDGLWLPLHRSAQRDPIPNGQPQIWKITHNGVDTHAIHFHLVNVQVINRVGWDGAINPPDPNEMGWKETVRMNPLEDVYVAMKADSPSLPFAVPDSSVL